MSRDLGAADRPGLVCGSLMGGLAVTRRCDRGSRLYFQGGSVMPAEVLPVAGKTPHFSARGCLRRFPELSPGHGARIPLDGLSGGRCGQGEREGAV